MGHDSRGAVNRSTRRASGVELAGPGEIVNPSGTFAFQVLQVLHDDRAIRSADVLVLSALVGFSRSGRVPALAREAIAEKAGVSLSSVKRALRRAIDRGEIAALHRYRPDSTAAPAASGYFLISPRLLQAARGLDLWAQKRAREASPISARSSRVITPCSFVSTREPTGRESREDVPRYSAPSFPPRIFPRSERPSRRDRRDQKPDWIDHGADASEASRATVELALVLHRDQVETRTAGRNARDLVRKSLAQAARKAPRDPYRAAGNLERLDGDALLALVGIQVPDGIVRLEELPSDRDRPARSEMTDSQKLQALADLAAAPLIDSLR